MKSHWPTVLPPFDDKPLRVMPGHVLNAGFVADLRDGRVSTPLEYYITCDIDEHPPQDQVLPSFEPSSQNTPRQTTATATHDPPTEDYSDWASAVDPATGDTYYFSAKTGATSWVWPPAP